MTFSIAIIGAGSVGFTKKLVRDLLPRPRVAGVESPSRHQRPQTST
jgi:alpha-galactosidase/6-phospho-beta-glucosidase family protein